MGLAWQTWGVVGLALVATGLVTWVMLHFTRALQVLKRAADRPVGFVASAVMFNAKLKTGVNLLTKFFQQFSMRNGKCELT